MAPYDLLSNLLKLSSDAADHLIYNLLHPLHHDDEVISACIQALYVCTTEVAAVENTISVAGNGKRKR